MMLATPSFLVAEKSSSGSKPRPPITLHKGHKGGYTNFPKAPDRQSITCTYDGMTLALDFAISEGVSTLTVTDETPQCSTFIIDTSLLSVSIPVGSLTGSISIELDTEGGNLFTGIIE